MNQWNDIYKKFEKYEYYDILKPHPDMEKVSKCFRNNDVKDILDVGCGMGRNLFYLLQEGFNVSGIDLSEKGIEFIRKETKNKIDLKVGDVFSKLPYDDASFDAIISVQVLQHSYEDKIKFAISEIRRILKPGGIVFITICGRYSKGKVRYCLVKTAKKVDERTFVPTIGDEKGLVHYIYDKKSLLRHYRSFKTLKLWKDDKDYFCFLGKIN